MKNSTKSQKKVAKDKKDTFPNFLKKTYEIVEQGQFPHLVDWFEGGDSFVIKKPKEFAQKVLPVYFKHDNLTSFTRQLNMYEFKKRKSSCYDYIFEHQHFRKGHKDELKFIKRRISANVIILKKNELNIEAPPQEDIEKAVQENYLLKRVHLEITQKIETSERNASKLSFENQQLYNAIQDQCQNQETLRTIIEAIGCAFGQKSVDQVMNLSNEKLLSSQASSSSDSDHHRQIKEFLAQRPSISDSPKPRSEINSYLLCSSEYDPLDCPISIQNDPGVRSLDFQVVPQEELSDIFSFPKDLFPEIEKHDEFSGLLKQHSMSYSPKSHDTCNSLESNDFFRYDQMRIEGKEDKVVDFNGCYQNNFINELFGGYCPLM